MLSEILYNLIDVDVKTLIAVLFWGNLTSVSLVFSFQIASKNVSERKLAAYFITAKLLQAVAYLLIFFRGFFPDFLTVNLGNSLILAGFYFEAISIFIVVHEENKKWHHLVLVIAVISIIVFNIIEYTTPDTSLRITVSSFTVFLILLVPSLKLLLSNKSTWFKRSVGVYYIVFVALLLPRGIYAISNTEADIFTNFLIQSLTFLALVMLMVFSLSAYLLLLKESSDKVIHHMATSDYLTGLSNRQNFYDEANVLFDKIKRKKKTMAVLFMDIDHFKKINDTYGHTFGDEVLIQFSESIGKSLREDDLSCRYGGEEFVVFLSTNGLANAKKVATRIMNGIKDLHFGQFPDFTFTISIGIAYGVPKKEEHLNDYIDRADCALYEAKNNGRNRIEVFKAS
ncbi:GGDEF domain-containing protein [Brucepastera parasyntrophica]|uniref:GGDEF domain-containing protein n=1 Tax=Brucepastera parasyntrophica TaxID=2880008 RepID=UPI002109F2D8|nr:GGDEF domain-containing protein [Brucepastera parasyntrophica]ULQ58962.1 GGDEF domain-containing protein [Brucepastera parasyntrophica]